MNASSNKKVRNISTDNKQRIGEGRTSSCVLRDFGSQGNVSPINTKVRNYESNSLELVLNDSCHLKYKDIATVPNKCHTMNLSDEEKGLKTSKSKDLEGNKYNIIVQDPHTIFAHPQGKFRARSLNISEVQPPECFFDGNMRKSTTCPEVNTGEYANVSLKDAPNFVKPIIDDNGRGASRLNRKCQESWPKFPNGEPNIKYMMENGWTNELEYTEDSDRSTNGRLKFATIMFLRQNNMYYKPDFEWSHKTQYLMMKSIVSSHPFQGYKILERIDKRLESETEIRLRWRTCYLLFLSSMDNESMSLGVPTIHMFLKKFSHSIKNATKRNGIGSKQVNRTDSYFKNPNYIKACNLTYRIVQLSLQCQYICQLMYESVFGWYPLTESSLLKDFNINTPALREKLANFLCQISYESSAFKRSEYQRDMNSHPEN